MKPETVLHNVFIDGTAAEAIPVNAEESADDPGVLLASRFFVPYTGSSEDVLVEIREGALSYADVPAVPGNIRAGRAFRVTDIGLESIYELPASQDSEILLRPACEGPADEVRLSAEFSADATILGCMLTEADADGNIPLLVHAGEPGIRTIQITDLMNGTVYRTTLTISSAPAYLYQGTIRVKQGVNLWDSPKKQRSLGKVPFEETVSVLEEENGWSLIRYGDLEGYTETRAISAK